MNIVQVGRNGATQFEYINGMNLKHSITNITESSFEKELNKVGNIILNNYTKEFSHLASMTGEEVKGTVQEVLSRMGEKEYTSLLNQGIAPENLDLDFLLISLEQLRRQSQEVEVVTLDGKDKSKVDKLADAFGNHQVPANESNISKGIQAIEKLDKFGNLSQEAIDYLLKQGKLPTIENIYKAEHSSNGNVDNTKQITDQEWISLSSQVNNILQNEGLEINDNNKNVAKELISKDIPVTKDNIMMYGELKEFKLDKNIDKVINNIAQAISNGQEADQALVINTFEQRYTELKNTINSVEDNHIQGAVASGNDVTINQLRRELDSNKRVNSNKEISNNKKINNEESKYNQEIKHHKEESNNKASEVKKDNYIRNNFTENNSKTLDYSHLSKEEIKVKLEIEELRLRLTLEAARKLESKGIHIETQKLENLVTELRQLELSTANKILEHVGAEVNEENANLLNESVSKVNDIKGFPLYTLGRFYSSNESPTIESLHTEGSMLSAQLKAQQATSSYDTMMTTIRPDLGDSLKKAFSNIDLILQDLDLEVNESNRKAVKILGYNQLDITKENIDTIKQLYQKVEHTLKNFTPAVAAHMIKNGLNPLKSEIAQLNQQINQIKDEYGLTQDEKIGKFIVEAENNGNITEDEKKNLIGLYRLINMISKTGGKAVGLLMKHDRQLNLSNLLEASKLLKTKGIEVLVDKEFGEIEKIQYLNEPIMNQLEEVLTGEALVFEELVDNIGYQQQLLSNILDQLTPAKLMEMSKQNDIFNISLEKFNELLEGITTEEILNEEREYVKGQIDKMNLLNKVDPSTYSFLNEYNITNSLKNILAAQLVLQQDYSIYQEIKKKVQSLDIRDEELDAIIEDFSTDRDEVFANVERVENYVDKVIKESIDKDIHQVDVEQLMTIKNSISLVKELSNQEYFQIPFTVNGKIEQLNIKLEKGNDTNQRINASVKTESLGTIKVLISLEEGKIPVQVVADSKESMKILMETKDELVRVLEGVGLTAPKIDYDVMNKIETKIEKNSIGYHKKGFEVVV